MSSLKETRIKLSPKQFDSYETCNARLNIWEGSVRAGKSYASLWALVKMAKEAPEGNLVIIGRTNSTIKRNIIDELLNFPLKECKYFGGTKQELHLDGRVFYCIGANDERAELKLRGATFSGAYVDEITAIPESVFKMLLSRLSRPGSKLLGTTNPDSPMHWLKKDYLDRAAELNIKIFKFKMEDNPSLTKDYIDALKKEYQGLWAKRLIDGEWCLAEGAIFPFFDEKLHTIANPPGYAKVSFVGVDIGFSNPTAFVLLSYNDETYPKLWIEQEYYHDAKKGTELTAADYAENLSRFVYGRNVRFIYVDPSAAAFKADLRKVNLYGAAMGETDNDVEQGIQSLASFIAAGDLKICRNCVNLIEEIQGYCWDTKASERGLDKPIKKRDHAIDAMRYAIYSYFGLKPTLRVPSQDQLEGKTLGNPKALLNPRPEPQNLRRYDWEAQTKIDQLNRKSIF
jgi:PBSX family phage terminase large subunit